MPSPFSLGVQNADEAFEAFADSQVAIGLVASGTGAAAVTGLGFTPDWVIFSVPANANALSWSATSTTLTLTGRSTTTAATVAYIAGNVS